MAQFNHPELGGYGQWMSGMVMIGSMSDHGLKSRVASLFADLMPLAERSDIHHTEGNNMEPMKPMRPMQPMQPMSPMKSSQFDVPKEWGNPASAGGQNDLRYAYYPIPHRLVVERSGSRSTYDTADHDITGVSQQQSSDQSGDPIFTSQRGSVALSSLKIVKH
jgi:hypothetical protein